MLSSPAFKPSIALSIALLWGLVIGPIGCASAPEPAADPAVAQVVEAPAASPGAQRWQGAALRLPAGSPAVVVLAPDALLGGLGELKDWIVAEPAMFGEEGEALVEAIETYWLVSTGVLGADPADASAWAERGVDVTRKIYGGLYPLDADGLRFVDEVDEGLRQAFAIPPGVDLLEGIDPAEGPEPAAIPAGVNAEILRRVSGLEPVLGARLLVPTTDPTTLIEGLSDAALSTGFRPLDPEQEQAMGLGIAGRAFVGEGAARPAFAMRGGEAYVTIDVVLPLYSGAALRAGDAARDEEALVQALIRAVSNLTVGRPASPRPAGDPALALSVHQPSMARLVRLRGYRSVLQGLQTSGAGRRDAQLVSELGDVLMHARGWELRAEALPGMVYGVSLGKEGGRRALEVDLSLFGAEELPELESATSARALPIHRSAVGVAIDLSPLFEPAWQAWFGIEDPRQASDDLEGGNTDPIAFFATMPRTLLVLMANLSKADEDGFAPELAPLVEQLRGVSRVELVVPSPDLSDFYTRPGFTAVVSLESSLSDEARTRAAQRSVGALSALLQWLTGAPASGGAPPVMQENIAMTREISPELPQLHQVFDSSSELPWLGLAMDRDESAAEARVVALTEEEPLSRESVAFARVEPVALLSLLTAVDPERFEPLDVRILAQRLGPMVLEVRPDEVEGARVVRWSFELQRPPEL